MKISGVLLWVSVAMLAIVGGAFLIMNNSTSKTIGQAVNTQSTQNLIDISPSTDTQLPTTNTPKPTTPSVKTSNVVIERLEFFPATLTINVGDTVTWTNMETLAHDIVSDTGNEISSPTLGQGQIYSHTFTTQGTYTYHGSMANMKGTIIVV
jgi:plastocyanin